MTPYKTGYFDGLTNKPRRGSLLYKISGSLWRAYERGYKNGTSARI